MVGDVVVGVGAGVLLLCRNVRECAAICASSKRY